MVSILKNYVRGPIIDGLSEGYKKELNLLLKSAEKHGLMWEVLQYFQTSVQNDSITSESDILWHLREACLEWDVNI
jgi:hypothetical protein